MFCFLDLQCFPFRDRKMLCPEELGRGGVGGKEEGVDLSDGFLHGVVDHGVLGISLILVSVRGVQEERIGQCLS